MRLSRMDAKIQYHKQQMQLAREGMAKGIKYSSRRLGGHTTQYRRLCRLAGIPVIVKTTIKVSPVIGKPCRYKACKGRNHKAHGEKCPVASARGKTGGQNGEGDSKKRVGSSNGNYRDVRPCGCPMRQHKPTCHLAQPMSSSKVKLTMIQRNTRSILNIKEVSWIEKAIPVSAVANYLNGVSGVCGSCSKSVPANKAKKIHKDDVYQNPVRIICDACEA